MAAGTGAITTRDLITEVLSILKVYSPGDALAAADAQTCLFTLGGIFDGYAAERLTFWQLNTLGAFSTSAGKNSYTIAAAAGSGVDWVISPLPTRFDYVSQSMGNPSATGPLEIGLRPLTSYEWERISLKTLGNSILESYWPNYGATSHVLTFFPTPTASLSITLYVAQQTAGLASLDTLIQLPPGYQEPITYELAIKVSSKFGANLPAWLPEAWAEAKARLKAKNFEALDVRADRALLSEPGRGFNGGGSIDFYLGK